MAVNGVVTQPAGYTFDVTPVGAALPQTKVELPAVVPERGFGRYFNRVLKPGYLVGAVAGALVATGLTVATLYPLVSGRDAAIAAGTQSERARIEVLIQDYTVRQAKLGEREAAVVSRETEAGANEARLNQTVRARADAAIADARAQLVKDRRALQDESAAVQGQRTQLDTQRTALVKQPFGSPEHVAGLRAQYDSLPQAQLNLIETLADNGWQRGFGFTIETVEKAGADKIGPHNRHMGRVDVARNLALYGRLYAGPVVMIDQAGMIEKPVEVITSYEQLMGYLAVFKNRTASAPLQQ